MVGTLVVSVLGVAAGGGVWWLIQKSPILSTIPAWVRLYVAFFVSVVVAATVLAFFGGPATEVGAFGNLAVDIFIGYVFAEAVRYNTPATWANWRRIKRKLFGGDRIYMPD